VDMVELDIEIDNDLITKAHDLALQYFGDDSDVSLAQVLEVAFRMRCLWSRSVRRGQQETDEAVSNWDFPKRPVTGENTDTIYNWLFRR